MKLSLDAGMATALTTGIIIRLSLIEAKAQELGVPVGPVGPAEASDDKTY
jgi:hypothetical protein